MIFQKSASTLSRSTLAATRAQNFWGTSSSQQSQPVPGFFVSTPQFTRHQQSQVAPYQDDTRGAGSSGPGSDSGNIGNPYLALTGGANIVPAAPAPSALDDERKEDPVTARKSSTKSLHLVAEVKHEPPLDRISYENSLRESIADLVDSTGETNVIDGVMTKMLRLQAVGSHRHVLATFETLVSLQEPLPIEAYNIALESLASSATDVTVVLEAYERLLAENVRPNARTYSIVVNSLVSVASELSAKRKQLQPFIGTEIGVLESVDEIIEALAVEEHLTLAMGLLQAVVATHGEQQFVDQLRASLDSAVAACIEQNVEVPTAVLHETSAHTMALINAQSSIEDAAEAFTSLDPEDQASEKAQSAMMSTYLRLKEPRGAIAFFDGCGSPRFLLRPLLTGLASLGLVGTARRWVEQLRPDSSVIGAVLKAIPHNNAKDYLPSATQLFYEHVGSSSTNGSGSDSDHNDNGGRCAFMRLCVEADDVNTLYMALRESHLNDSLLDPVTVTQVVNFLSRNNQPMLAADVFAWQFPKLSKAWIDLDITSFVGQEMASDAISAFQKREQLSLAVSIRMLPFVMSSPRAREAVFEVIAAARLGAPHEIAELVNSETLAAMVNALSTFYTRATGVADSEFNIVRNILPLFVEDALAAKSEFTDSEGAVVAEALLSIENTDALLSLWHRRHPSPMSSHQFATAKESAAIQRYALLPNGIDNAVQLLQDQMRLNKRVAPAAIDAVFQACARDNAVDIMEQLYALLPKTRTMLNSLIMASVHCYRELAFKALDDLRRMELHADLPVYNALIATSKDVSEASALFDEAKNDAKLPLTPQLYNDTVSLLARNLRKAQVEALLQQMGERNFEVLAPTWGSIISMHTRLDEGELALSKLKKLPMTVKSLLEVKTFNHLMHYFVHKKANRKAALDVFVELRSTGTLATPFTYRLLMEAYLLLNQTEKASLDKADNVLALMRYDGAPITTMCFATLLRARGVLFKDFDGARNFYRGLVKNSRVLPDQNIFKALMESYVSNGRQSETALVFDEMKRYHVSVDDDIAELAGSSLK